MESSEITAIITTLVASHLGIDESQLEANASFLEHLGADSLDSVEIVRSVEERFELEISGSDVMNFDSVAQIVKYLSERLSSS